jgi:hypothetical protein
MPIICEDLAQCGVVLIPPSAPEYPQLVAEILNRLRSRPKGGPPVDDETIAFDSEHDNEASAVLLNQAARAIVSIAYIWHVRLADRDGRVVTHSFLPGTNASVLLPFQLNDRIKKFDYYWRTIFPGSKRFIRFDGQILGDNTDVRPPEPDELWHGGFFGFGGGKEREGKEPVKLTLDGIFFEDGGFAGPDRLGAWEQTVSAAETYLEVATLAREAQRSGVLPADFFFRIRSLTGQPEEGRLPPPPPPGPDVGRRNPRLLRERERSMVGWQVLQMRKHMSDEAVIEHVAHWSDIFVPKFHKL